MTSSTLAMLTWTTRPPDRRWLRAEGFAVLTFADLRERFVAPTRTAGLHRASLESPSAALLERFAAHQAVAVVDVAVRDRDDVGALYGFAPEPAWRAGCRLLLHAERTLLILKRRSSSMRPLAIRGRS